MRTKKRIYQNMCTQNVFLTEKAYLKRLAKRKVRVRLNRSKPCKVRLKSMILRGNPALLILVSTVFKLMTMLTGEV